MIVGKETKHTYIEKDPNEFGLPNLPLSPSNKGNEISSFGSLTTMSIFLSKVYDSF